MRAEKQVSPLVYTLLNRYHSIQKDHSGFDPNRQVTLGTGTGSSSPVVPATLSAPDPQIVERATRRRFTDSYKLSILEQAHACHDRGEVGALLRREGLYYSTLANFRKQKAAGELGSSGSRKKRASKDPALAAAVSQQIELERENRKLRRQLARAAEIITIQKKAALLLGETHSIAQPLPLIETSPLHFFASDNHRQWRLILLQELGHRGDD